jgi:transcriptional regulator with XRE-family HTH domain
MNDSSHVHDDGRVRRRQRQRIDNDLVEGVAVALDADRAELARRLRQLRTATWSEHTITQAQLGKALGVSAPSISSWETGSATPPRQHLAGYAILFATERSLASGRMRKLDERELTDVERTRREALERELAALMVTEARPPSLADDRYESLWRFDDGQDVTIVCAPLPQDLHQRMPYANPDDPDHIELYSYADLDALFELHGHVRALNPHSQVNLRLASELTGDDYTAHLAVLGGVDWNELTRDLLKLVDIPVRHIPSEDPNGGGFEIVEHGKKQAFRPVLSRVGHQQILEEDVAHFYRGPNPYNQANTVTICNGIYGRGTYAAVRTLTDTRFRERNEGYVRTRFAESDTFSILARTRIVHGKAVTPDWSLPTTCLHEWARPNGHAGGESWRRATGRRRSR